MARTRKVAASTPTDKPNRLLFSLTLGAMFLAGVFGAVVNSRDAHGGEHRSAIELAAEQARSPRLPFVPCATPADYSDAMPLGIQVTAVANWDGEAFRPGSLLAGIVTETDTALPLDDEGTGFPSTEHFRVKVGDEILEVKAGDTADSLDVTRGSAAVRHERGDAIAFCPERHRLQRLTLQSTDLDRLATVVVVKPGPLGLARLTEMTGSLGGSAGAGTFSGSVRISDGEHPTGTLVFALFDEEDEGCTDDPVATFRQTVDGVGVYGPEEVLVPSDAHGGEHPWRVSYMGDAANRAVDGQCNPGGGPLTMSASTEATLTGAASEDVAAAGGEISDSATLKGLIGLAPGGSLTFSLFRPDDPGCAGPALAVSAPIPVNADGTYESGGFPTTQAGIHRWIVTYSGDGDNAAMATTCGAPAQDKLVLWLPAVAATAADAATTGAGLPVTATFANGSPELGGEVTLEAFSDAMCRSPAAFSATVPVTLPRTSGTIPVLTPGHYFVRARYSGDAENASAASPCGAVQTSMKVSPTLRVTATSPPGGAGPVAIASFSGPWTPSAGTIRFRAYGTPDCTGAPMDAGLADVRETPPTSDVSDGALGWSASYSGDPDHLAAESECFPTTEAW